MGEALKTIMYYSLTKENSSCINNLGRNACFNHSTSCFPTLVVTFPVILEPILAGQRARDYLNVYVKPTLLAGLTALCKEKPADPMVRAV